jgi:type VI secretion system protein ImpC
MDPDAPFRILVVGDFSGRGNRGVHESLAGRRPVSVDLDNFDEVLEGMGAALRLPHAALFFHEMDGFHPDAVYQRAELFRKLADVRTRPAPTRQEAQAAAAPRSVSLDSMFSETETREGAGGGDELSAFINRIMAPHLEERPDKRKIEWAAQVDEVAAGEMRAVLHDPHFQGLEAIWRGLWLLVHTLNPDEELTISVFDATLAELLAEPERMQALIAGKPGHWAVIAGDYEFGQGASDAKRLYMLGRAAKAAQAPFVASAAPPADEVSPDWNQLRTTAEGKWVGLILPRFLLRLPYGKKTVPAEVFPFEEMPQSNHLDYLWGNPAFVCACLLGRSYRRQGWSLRLGSDRQIDGLPQHIYTEDGQPVSKPCAEVLMSEKEAEFLMERGFMPLASMKEQDAVLLVRFQSIADPPAALPGRW